MWLRKLHGFPEYIAGLTGRTVRGTYIEWRRLRSDPERDDLASLDFGRWLDDPVGRAASEEVRELTRAWNVPHRPWHGASSGERVFLDLALAIASGGTLNTALSRLTPAAREQVLAAVTELATGTDRTHPGPVPKTDPPKRQARRTGENSGPVPIPTKGTNRHATALH